MLEILYLITTLSIGIFAGALLTEGCVLVPYWRKMEAAEFFRLHSRLGPGLFRYFAPLTTVAVALSVISAIAAQWTNDGSVGYILAAGLCAAALLVFFGYFKQANAQFARQSLAENELPDALSQWARWHWLRTILVGTAFVCSISVHAV